MTTWDMELSEASFLTNPGAKVGGSVTLEWVEQDHSRYACAGRCAEQPC